MVWSSSTASNGAEQSNETAGQSTSTTPGNKFLTDVSGIWYTGTNPVDLWQLVSGINVNNPCPSGFRLPTDAEWSAERSSWSANPSVGALASPLKLPVAGYRYHDGGPLAWHGTEGYYWSSKVNTNNSYSRYLNFSSSNAEVFEFPRANGMSVRCIKD